MCTERSISLTAYPHNANFMLECNNVTLASCQDNTVQWINCHICEYHKSFPWNVNRRLCVKFSGGHNLFQRQAPDTRQQMDARTEGDFIFCPMLCTALDRQLQPIYQKKRCATVNQSSLKTTTYCMFSIHCRSIEKME